MSDHVATLEHRAILALREIVLERAHTPAQTKRAQGIEELHVFLPHDRPQFPLRPQPIYEVSHGLQSVSRGRPWEPIDVDMSRGLHVLHGPPQARDADRRHAALTKWGDKNEGPRSEAQTRIDFGGEILLFDPFGKFALEPVHAIGGPQPFQVSDGGRMKGRIALQD